MTPNMEQRFWQRVSVREGDACWEWTGWKEVTGYGTIRSGGKRFLVHRYSYELHVGPIPCGLTIDHLCRNRACVNPYHLEPVTRGVNVLRGMSSAAQAARRNHCEKGHEYTPENTRTTRGWRECRQCGRDKNNARLAAPEARAERNRVRRERYSADEAYRRAALEAGRRTRERYGNDYNQKRREQYRARKSAV